MKHFEFEYGAGTMGADLPDSTDEFIPGVTMPDPAYIPNDRLEAAYRESLDHPIGMQPVKELVHRGSKVVFVVPDRVKGGEQPTSHRKLSIKYILQDLYSAGVEKKTFSLLSPTACTRVRLTRMRSLSSALNSTTNSGLPARSSAMIPKTRTTWLI